VVQTTYKECTNGGEGGRSQKKQVLEWGCTSNPIGGKEKKSNRFSLDRWQGKKKAFQMGEKDEGVRFR